MIYLNNVSFRYCRANSNELRGFYWVGISPGRSQQTRHEPAASAVEFKTFQYTRTIATAWRTRSTAAVVPVFSAIGFTSGDWRRKSRRTLLLIA